MNAHFATLAAYNRWANRRIYAAAAALPDIQYREHRGAFFGSLHGTLNHILVADRIWLHRLTGAGPLPARLNEILCEDLPGLTRAREAEDARILAYVGGLGDADWDRVVTYRNTSGKENRNTVSQILIHYFNHQTHHRGQAHGILTGLGRDSVVLDLIAFLREAA